MPAGPRVPGALTTEIAALLREHIARKQWNQTTVAEAAGIATSTFNDLINGRKIIDIEQLDRIAWAARYPLVELVKKAEENTVNRQTSVKWTAVRLTDPS